MRYHCGVLLKTLLPIGRRKQCGLDPARVCRTAETCSKTQPGDGDEQAKGRWKRRMGLILSQERESHPVVQLEFHTWADRCCSYKYLYCEQGSVSVKRAELPSGAGLLKIARSLAGSQRRLFPLDLISPAERHCSPCCTSECQCVKFSLEVLCCTT